MNDLCLICNNHLKIEPHSTVICLMCGTKYVTDENGLVGRTGIYEEWPLIAHEPGKFELTITNGEGLKTVTVKAYHNEFLRTEWGVFFRKFPGIPVPFHRTLPFGCLIFNHERYRLYFADGMWVDFYYNGDVFCHDENSILIFKYLDEKNLYVISDYYLEIMDKLDMKSP